MQNFRAIEQVVFEKNCKNLAKKVKNDILRKTHLKVKKCYNSKSTCHIELKIHTEKV